MVTAAGLVLSSRMVQWAHAVLRNALSNAVREELVTRNVAKLVKVSTPDYQVGTGLDPIAAQQFLAAVRNERLYALYLGAVLLGMRRGELLGLTWSAIDFDNARLSIRQTLTVVNGRLSFEPPKTKKSRRIIPVPALMLDALRERRAAQEEERAAAGERWTDTDLVFAARDGGLPSPATLGVQWRALREKLGLGSMRFHDLRHTCVSLLLALGVPPHVVREIVGHSDIKVTMMVYAHANLDEHAAALDQLSARLQADTDGPI